MTSGALAVRLFDSIDEIEPAEWDSLLPPGDLQASHRFVKTCQDSGIERARYRHVLISRHGRLEAIASLSLLRVALDLLSPGPIRVPARWARRLWGAFLSPRLVVCGLPVSFNRSCLRLRPGLGDPAAALAAVAAAAEEFARDAGASTLCFKEFTREEAERLDALERQGYFRAASLPSCHLDLRWRSFEGYVGQMRAGYRRQLLQSRAAAERAGLEVRSVDDLGPVCGRFYPLYEQVMDRAEFQLERLPPAFFEHLAANLRGETRALLVERDGRLLGAALLLLSPRETTFLLTGLDYAAGRAHHLYPHLVACVVEEAIRAGAPRLELGQTSYPLKGRLGARFTPRYLYLRHRSRRWNRLLEAASGRLFPTVAPRPRRVFKATFRPSG